MARQTIPNSGLWSSIAALLNANFTETYDETKVTREQLLRGSSLVTQNPTATDTPISLTFGAGQLGPTDPVSLDADPNDIPANGEANRININETDQYWFRLSPQYGRAGSSGTSWIWFRVMLSIDGGTTYSQNGQSVLAKLDGNADDFPYQAELFADLQAGWKIKVEMMRGSEGTNDGGLIYAEPAEGTWNPAYSIDLIVSRLVTNVGS